MLNVVMAVPSVLLPLPLQAPYDLSLDVTLYDSEINQLANRKIDAKARAVFYSIWSMSKLYESVAKADDDATIALVLEMIQEQRKK